MTGYRNYDPDHEIDRISFALFLQILIFQLTGFLPKGTNQTEIILLGILECLFYSLSFILPSYYLTNTKNKPNIDNKAITFEKKRPENTLCIIFAFLGTLSVTSRLTSYLVSLLQKFGIGVYLFVSRTPENFADTVLLFISSVILPPLCEELLFRKVLLGKLRKYGDLFAVIFSSVCFSLMHCNISQFPYAFCAGLIMGTVTLKNGSAFFSVLLHFVNNFISFCFIILEKYTLPPVYEKASISFDLALAVIGIVCLVIIIKKGFFNIKNDEKTENFKIFRPVFLLYTAMILYLTSRWFYLI